MKKIFLLLRNFLENRWVKLIFSIAIITAAIPDIIIDLKTPGGGWTHWGVAIVGISNMIESIFWIGDIWAESPNKSN